MRGHKDLPRQRRAGLSLLEVVAAAGLLSVSFMAAHYSATMAWSFQRRAAVASQNALRLWNRASRLRTDPNPAGSPLALHPDLRPLQRTVLEEQGLEWEVLRAR